jgi:hypothetical protein
MRRGPLRSASSVRQYRASRPRRPAAAGSAHRERSLRSYAVAAAASSAQFQRQQSWHSPSRTAAEGRQFLAAVSAPASDPTPIDIVLNWTSLLRSKWISSSGVIVDSHPMTDPRAAPRSESPVSVIARGIRIHQRLSVRAWRHPHVRLEMPVEVLLAAVPDQ